MAKTRKTLFAGGRANRKTSAGAIQGLVVSGLEQHLGRIKSVNRAVAREAGEIILRNTLPYVPKETGKLRDTGRVELGESRAGNTTVQVKFGSTSVDYAVFVHENMPRNVEQKQYTTPGTGPKYLQIGAAESVNEVDNLIKTRLKAAAKSSTGSSGSNT